MNCARFFLANQSVIGEVVGALCCERVGQQARFARILGSRDDGGAVTDRKGRGVQQKAAIVFRGLRRDLPNDAH